jgi:AcrR family transcriptional regulator
MMYDDVMPKLWNDTIEAHRRSVDDAILSATVGLASDHGLASLTMSQVAAAVGIGRATLYKYYPDVDAILVAWHERQIGEHLAQLAEVGQQAGPPIRRLTAVLTAFASISREQHSGELAALLHRGEHVRRAQAHLRDFVAHLIADAAAAGDVRSDVPPAELAGFCLHALTAAGTTSSAQAVNRLVKVTMAGLRP